MKPEAIFLDLDGTLLSSSKELSARNYNALKKAAEAGAYIVPTTGRLFCAIPEVICASPFVRYAITINGAQLYDKLNNTSLHDENIPTSRALDIFDLFDKYTGIYDCYAGNWGYMERQSYENAAIHVHNIHSLKMIREYRTPVDDLKNHILKTFDSVQKVQMFFSRSDEPAAAMAELRSAFPDCFVSASVPYNIEINSLKANKGEALRLFCNRFGIHTEASVAFGDGLNDIPMLEAAGTGVAMSNACDEVRAAADIITCTNDEDGVAVILEQLFS